MRIRYGLGGRAGIYGHLVDGVDTWLFGTLMLTCTLCLAVRCWQGWLEDVSKVEKYVMSDADYDAREDTYRKFKEERLREVR